MREPPDLADDSIVGALQAGFGIRVAELAFLPVGNDPDSWAYRVEPATGPPRFLKVRAGAGAMPGAAVPALLRRRGLPHVFAPLPTRAGAPYLALERFTLALYPMLDARSGAEVGLSPAQWRQLGAAVARVHSTAQTPELTRLVRREAFRPSRRELLPELEAVVAGPARGDPVAAELAALWRARREVIDTLVAAADRLGRRAARSPSRPVLCHADLHTFNVLVEKDHGLWIVEGYGDTSIDPDLLAYYRHAWAVQDIAAYGEEALLSSGAGAMTRQAAVAGFKNLFEPGNIVELALSTADLA